jgi:hypothetical protein
VVTGTTFGYVHQVFVEVQDSPWVSGRRIAKLYFRVSRKWNTTPRVHHRCQHKSRRIAQRYRSASDSDPPILQWLPEDIQHILPELRELIEKENTVVRQAHLTRPWMGTTSHQPCIGYRMMGSTERACRLKWLMGL